MEEGIYKSKTVLPSFMGNSVMVTLGKDRDKMKFFFGISEARMTVKKDNLNIYVDINLEKLCNYDISWYKYLLVKKNISENSILSVHVSNSNSEIFYDGKIYKSYCDLQLKPYELMGKKFVRIIASIYLTNKGFLDDEKKIYIENIKLRLNLLKVRNE
ncbi:MAG: hypothetical protein RMJ51_03410 [Candidatus Calescibacterium sp.]|nr:hypothetical protein [Candidatus Calescibacterium sp.]MCX7971667.1 hypothetical protein [bacterium]MDW8195273.1 hypothetical protein [Candidatus Calescibacterium sp.]